MPNPSRLRSIGRLLNMAPEQIRGLFKQDTRGVVRPPGYSNRRDFSEVEISPSRLMDSYDQYRPDHALDFTDPGLAKYHTRKLRRLVDWLGENDDALEMPKLWTSNYGAPDIGDGRHRTALADYAGLRKMTAVSRPDDYEALSQLGVVETPRPFGALERFDLPDDGLPADFLTKRNLLSSSRERATPERRSQQQFIDWITDEMATGNPSPGSKRFALIGRSADETPGAAMLVTEQRDAPAFVELLGSLERGGGTQMMKALRDQHTDATDISLKATPSATSFYESLGMEPRQFRASPTDTSRKHTISTMTPWLRTVAPLGALSGLGAQEQ
jgi:hypothetical protein